MNEKAEYCMAGKKLETVKTLIVSYQRHMHTDIQTDTEAERQIGRLIGRQVDRHMNTRTHSLHSLFTFYHLENIFALVL